MSEENGLMPDSLTQFAVTGSRRGKLRHGSLFTGVGGMDLGLDVAGFKIVWQVEKSPYCLRVLKKHWPDVPKFSDVRKCGKHNLEPVDVITGGYPCQDHSIAGKGRGLGTPDNPTDRSGLWFHYLRNVRELRPRWVLVENVYRLLRTKDGDKVVYGIEDENYSCWPLVLDAAILGAPHWRQRAWILCRRNDPVLGFDFEAARAERWSLARECRVALKAAQEIWDCWKRELSGPNREHSDRVTTPTATAILEPDWPGARLWPAASGRPRKLMNNGSDSSMSWILEMAVRASTQGNDNLAPTPEKCEEFMGFPRGWTDLGTNGDKDAAWEKMRRKIFGPRYWRDRFRALGNAVVPQIPMLFGSFIQEYESRAAAVRSSSAHPDITLPAYVVSYAGAGDSKEGSMSENLPEQEMSKPEAGQAPAGSVTGSADAGAHQPERDGLNGEHQPQESADARRPSQADPGQPGPASLAAGSPSAGTHGSSRSDVIGDAEAYLRSYLSFPDGKYFLPLALLAALEHCWDKCFDEVPYLSVGAAVKSAGKTRVLELLSFLAGEEKAVLVDGSITEAALYTEIGGGKTILIDESERLHNPSSSFRPILNGGYRRGQHVYRKNGGQNEKFSTYCPKVFSHIGDLYDSLRDRCIIVHMQRTIGGGRKEYDRTVARAEGNAIGGRMEEAISARLEEIRKAYRQYQGMYPSLSFLRDRDKEVWKPLFSLCQLLAPSRIPELERSAIDIATLKTLPIRRFDALAEEEKRSEEMEYGERLVTDAISVMDGHERMATSELVQGLRALHTSPWRTYRGSGITDDASGAMLLASLLKHFGVEPKTIRVRPKGEPNSTAKGYTRADLIAGAERGRVPLGDGKGRNPVTSAAIAAGTARGPSEPHDEGAPKRTVARQP